MQAYSRRPTPTQTSRRHRTTPSHTGPLYYDYDPENKWWKNPIDGHLMVELLVRELMHSTSVYINL